MTLVCVLKLASTYNNTDKDIQTNTTTITFS